MAPIILNCSKVCYFYSKIAKSFQMGPTKLRYFVNFRVAPYSKSILIENIKGSSYYIVWFDDSVNSMTVIWDWFVTQILWWSRLLDETELMDLWNELMK